MVNGHVALAFEELALLHELEGESPFKVRAYRAFAEVARTVTEPLAAIEARGELESMPGVGKAIAGKVRELLAGGTMRSLQRARDQVPVSVRKLLELPTLTSNKVRKLWKEAGVTDLDELALACVDGRVAKLSGFTAKNVAQLLEEARAASAATAYVLLAQAHGLASFIIPQLLAAGAPRVRTAGPVRRGHELVEELTLIVEGLEIEAVAAVIEPRGEHAALAIVSRDARTLVAKPPANLGPPLRVITSDAAQFLETLVRETGSDVHVAALEARAIERGTTLAAACHDLALEEDLYASLDLPFVPAELREEGLITPPRGLLPVRGVQGVFHVHTTWSDGTASIAEMARAAAEAGFGYVGISDHSRAAVYANGLDPARLAAQRVEIEAARREVPGVVILHGVEVDVLEDGSLDLPDDTLASLDFVVASVHTHFTLDVAAQTKRMVRALGHPLVTILGHPTGRLLLGRAGYTFDLDEVARAAALGGVFLEINASPQRLDLCPEMIRRAAELGARFCINPDAHEPRGFADVPLGVAQARRAALRSDQVLNSRGVDDIVETLRMRRAEGRARLGQAASPS